ncbi:MAG: hydrogenase maturation protease [Chloroflexi bacterium]|nr:hydrogenase maturation protease [Chloroflexota bacterium]
MPFEKILLIGLGNPILGDDGVGWVVAREAEERIRAEGGDLEVDFLSLGGLSLMERLIGWKRVILVDSLTTGKQPQGEVISFTLEDLVDITSGHTAAAHDTSLKTALATGRQLGADLPDDADIHIVAIESQHVYDIQEGLTPAIASAVPTAVQRVFSLFKDMQST